MSKCPFLCVISTHLYKKIVYCLHCTYLSSHHYLFRYNILSTYLWITTPATYLTTSNGKWLPLCIFYILRSPDFTKSAVKSDRFRVKLGVICMILLKNILIMTSSHKGLFQRIWSVTPTASSASQFLFGLASTRSHHLSLSPSPSPRCLHVCLFVFKVLKQNLFITLPVFTTRQHQIT